MLRFYRGKIFKKEGVLKLFSKSISCCSTDNDSGNEFDISIIGGGIIGSATASALVCKYPRLQIVLLEKENKLGAHQSSHNSGVVHAGIYYVPGSLKAKLCVQGMKSTFDYCEKKNIPYKKIGKLIVATNCSQVKTLATLHERGIKNEVPDLQLLECEEAIRKIVPECKGLKALWSPHTFNVDFRQITESHGKDFKENGGTIRLKFEVTKIIDSQSAEYPIQISDKSGQYVRTKYVLSCAGLYSDKIAAMTGCSYDPRVIPFRGEYLVLRPEKQSIVKCNIYPMPDPRYPFPAIRVTPRMDGSVLVGPNDVLAFSREGYRFSDVKLRELGESITNSGFRKLSKKYFTYGIKETMKSIYYPLQVKSLRQFLPSISKRDVCRGPTSVRAQAVYSDGTLVDDFHVDTVECGAMVGRVLHCRIVPSPGGTSSMAVAKLLIEKMSAEFCLS